MDYIQWWKTPYFCSVLWRLRRQKKGAFLHAASHWDVHWNSSPFLPSPQLSPHDSMMLSQPVSSPLPLRYSPLPAGLRPLLWSPFTVWSFNGRLRPKPLTVSVHTLCRQAANSLIRSLRDAGRRSGVWIRVKHLPCFTIISICLHYITYSADPFVQSNFQ